MPAHFAPGHIVAAQFRVVSLLAEGGMGAVYVVEHLATGRKRALKVMRTLGTSDQALEDRRRFAQEARVGALIQSEHVVDVIDAGVDDGCHWLLMELLEGEDLGTLMNNRTRLHPREVYEIFRQLCHGMAAAHTIPCVHRDLKPENIFLARSRVASLPFLLKVLDFGIAKVLADSVRSTSTVGTPLWMAPEQAEADKVVDVRADVWALGLIAFYLLSGRIYWLTAHNPSAAVTALLRELLFDPIVPASERARALGADPLPEGFDAWFSRCVTRQLDERFASAQEAWDALAPVLKPDGSSLQTIPTYPRVVLQPAAKWDTNSAKGVVQDTTQTAPSIRPSRPPRTAWKWGVSMVAIACIAMAGTAHWRNSSSPSPRTASATGNEPATPAAATREERAEALDVSPSVEHPHTDAIPAAPSSAPAPATSTRPPASSSSPSPVRSRVVPKTPVRSTPQPGKSSTPPSTSPHTGARVADVDQDPWK